MADFNQGFSQPPRTDMDVHRSIPQDDELDLIFRVEQLRKVSHLVTLPSHKVMFLPANVPFTRTLISQYIDVFDYPDGRLEIRVDGTTLTYVGYGRSP